MILWEGSRMALIGAAIGLAMALALPKIFEAMFYDLHVGEPGIYVIVAICIFSVALLATYIPARGATRVDPMTALRQE
jgi:ABC-type antimicrobial peptide transport system permease subunit